ncbi:MAG: hypothetical protein IPM79_06015 [Polyangiaceae bacterium]|nr:hypothetical protein [Polyangiaceae bacterium]
MRRRRIRRAPALGAALSALLAAACSDDSSLQETEPVGVAVSAISVAEAADTSCTTASVMGLSLQIIAQGNCIEPGAFSEVPDLANISFGDAVFPYLEEPARDALVDALEENPSMSLGINSMLRTVAQQLLLYRWYQEGRCGIGLAATPGNSNHETGLAFDTSQYAPWRPILEAHGFDWYGNADPVHYDYAGPDAVDHKGLDVLAFQQLWNDNNPNDPIAEDGEYGPQTEARLLAAPAEGFPGAVDCGPPPGDRPDVSLALELEGAADRFADGPSAGVADLFEDDPEVVWLTLANPGAAPASSVSVSVELGEALFEVDGFAITRSATGGGPFELDDATHLPGNPPQSGTLSGRLDFTVGSLAAGEKKRVELSITPIEYSVDDPLPPVLLAWVTKIDDLYEQSEHGGPVVNVDGSQTFGGGRLELALTADVYSHTRWEWQSPRLEGVSATGGLTFASSSSTLDLANGEPGAVLMLPASSLVAAVSAKVHLRASRTSGAGEATLLVSRKAPELEGAEEFALDLPIDGAHHDLTIDLGPGPIERVALAPFSQTPGEASLDYVRIEGAVPRPPAGEGGGDGGGAAGDDDEPAEGCDCSAAGAGAHARLGWLAAIALVGAWSRRRRSP